MLNILILIIEILIQVLIGLPLSLIAWARGNTGTLLLLAATGFVIYLIKDTNDKR